MTDTSTEAEKLPPGVSDGPIRPMLEVFPDLANHVAACIRQGGSTEAMARNTETLGLEMNRLLSEAQKYFDQAKALAAERDEADRRAGAAERQRAGIEETVRAQERWLQKAKEERGYEHVVSFDQVWKETCDKADASDALKAEVERLRDALILFAEAADEADDCGFDDFNQAPIDCGQCREARAALQENTGGA
jgi:hypothetical protein